MIRTMAGFALVAVVVFAILFWTDIYYVDPISTTGACMVIGLVAVAATLIARRISPGFQAKYFKRMAGFAVALLGMWCAVAIFHVPMLLLSALIEIQPNARGEFQPSGLASCFVKQEDGLLITNSDPGGRSGLYRRDRDARPYATWFETPISTHWAVFRED